METNGLDPNEVKHDIFNATGGKGKAITEFGRFLRDVSRGVLSAPPILVVAIDGNCSGYMKKRKEIEKVTQPYNYQGILVYAIPAPHIERWYMVDMHGFQRVAENGILTRCASL